LREEYDELKASFDRIGLWIRKKLASLRVKGDTKRRRPKTKN